MPSIEYVHIAPDFGAPVQAVAEAEAVADMGLVGDRKYGAGHGRDITIVSLEELAAAEQAFGAPIPPGSTRRNVTVSAGLLPRTAGARIMLGDVTVEVLQDCAPCEQMEESVGPGAREALKLRAGVRGRIARGGTIHVGDPVKIEG